ncbi:MAG: beta-galactosidase, partial [Anaerolineae bacterium]|nr:beta-galactosidase [Anaerolineae bacterium]
MPQSIIDLTQPDRPVISGHLRMGGSNPAGVEINANSRCLTLGGQPWLPVMGEFHFSRYPAAGWRAELLKMKAGGITIAATYIFWIHHEELQGEWDWSGNRDLRRFIALCAELGLLAYPRIGPWAHGECRNGGFPDWLLELCGEQVRQDNPVYLAQVRRLYAQIARQLDGLLWKDGGPVIGVQLENELIQDAAHILTLKKLAQDVGIDVPLYTMTGWGPAAVPEDEVIPLFGGYPDAFWNRDVSDWARECRKQYLFSPIRNDDLIGADLLRRRDMIDIAYLERYPFATCELGGGMQVSYHRRPAIQPADVSAPPICKLGSGSN